MVIQDLDLIIYNTKLQCVTSITRALINRRKGNVYKFNDSEEDGHAVWVKAQDAYTSEMFCGILLVRKLFIEKYRHGIAIGIDQKSGREVAVGLLHLPVEFILRIREEILSEDRVPELVKFGEPKLIEMHNSVSDSKILPNTKENLAQAMADLEDRYLISYNSQDTFLKCDKGGIVSGCLNKLFDEQAVSEAILMGDISI